MDGMQDPFISLDLIDLSFFLSEMVYLNQQEGYKEHAALIAFTSCCIAGMTDS
jgi:hypothetical protein